MNTNPKTSKEEPKDKDANLKGSSSNNEATGPGSSSRGANKEEQTGKGPKSETNKSKPEKQKQSAEEKKAALSRLGELSVKPEKQGAGKQGAGASEAKGEDREEEKGAGASEAKKEGRKGKKQGTGGRETKGEELGEKKGAGAERGERDKNRVKVKGAGDPGTAKKIGEAKKSRAVRASEKTKGGKKSPKTQNDSAFRAVTNTTRVFGRYELLMEVSHGGMATLYLARMSGPEKFEKLLAIKKIHPHLSQEPDFIAMFLDEARIAARIQHPNVATIFDLGEVDDSFFIAMEYVHGQNLREILREAARRKIRIPWEYSVSVVARAAAGLHAAHELIGPDGRPLQVVHRDISPQNILLSYTGHVKVVDFGIAFAAEKLGHTAAGTLKGKAAYMSPEQANGEPLDRRSDVFSLGIVLYESVCMRRLFRQDSQTATLMKVREAKVPPPSRVVRDIPAELERIIMKSLAKDRNDRYSTTREMAEDLEELLVAHGKATTSTKLSSLIEDLFHDRKKHKDIQIAQAIESPSVKVMKSVGADWNTGTSIELSSVTNPRAASGVEKGGGSKALLVLVGMLLAVFLAGGGYLFSRRDELFSGDRKRSHRAALENKESHANTSGTESTTDSTGAGLGRGKDGERRAGEEQVKEEGDREDGQKNKAGEDRAKGSEDDEKEKDSGSSDKVGSKRVRLRVQVSPRLSRVRVKFAGRWYRGAIFEAIVPFSEEPKDIEVSARGYLTKTIVVTPSEDTTLKIQLEKASRSRIRQRKPPRPPDDETSKKELKEKGTPDKGKDDGVLRDLPDLDG